MSRAARLFDVLQALRRRRRPVSAAVLACELGVSPRTVYRDIATLRGQGAAIEGEAGLGYQLQAGLFLPPLAFDETELDALILGLALVRRRGDPALAQGATDALAKIAAVLPATQVEASARAGLLAGPAGKGSAHLATLRAALRQEAKVRLSYADKAARPSDRIVWPVAIGFFEHVEMLAAWCELRGDFRHFRLDRIADATATGERLPRRHRVLLAEWRATQALPPPD